MNERARTVGFNDDDEVSFRALVAWWAESLGRHHIPLREHSNDINNLLAPDAVHHELIQAVVRKVYCANKCGHLGAGVSLEDTFTALGQMRLNLLRCGRADIDQINLLDDIGWHTRQYFGGMQGEVAPPDIEFETDAGDEEFSAATDIRAY